MNHWSFTPSNDNPETEHPQRYFELLLDGIAVAEITVSTAPPTRPTKKPHLVCTLIVRDLDEIHLPVSRASNDAKHITKALATAPRPGRRTATDADPYVSGPIV